MQPHRCRAVCHLPRYLKPLVVAPMPSDPDFVTLVCDTLSCVGEIRAKRMFGGHGVYCGERMIAIIVDDRLYLKVDADSKSRFEADGLKPFQYKSRGKTITMSFHEAPADIFEDPATARVWAEMAQGAAQRSVHTK